MHAGTVVTVSSVMGLIGAPKLADYRYPLLLPASLFHIFCLLCLDYPSLSRCPILSASKFALVGMHQSLRLEARGEERAYALIGCCIKPFFFINPDRPIIGCCPPYWLLLSLLRWQLSRLGRKGVRLLLVCPYAISTGR